METVNFRCGHCNGVLAVSKAHLGQQVRCPHCQQVILAPSSAGDSPAPPPPAPEPTMQMPPSIAPEEPESIFTARTTEDLFGHLPAPDIELPSGAPPSFPHAEQTVPEHPAEYQTPAPAEATLPFPGNPTSAPTTPEADRTEVLAPSGNDGQTTTWAAPPPAPTAVSDSPPEPFGPGGPGIPHMDPATEAILNRPRKRGGGLMIVLVVSLASYSIGTTILVVVLYLQRTAMLNKKEEVPHPLDNLPDFEGDNPVGKPRAGLRLSRPRPTLDVLPERRVKLGETIRVNAVEVTPLKVYWDKIAITAGKKGKPDVPDQPALKLTLRVKNVTEDLTFCPLDRYFTRWHVGEGKEKGSRWNSADRPYTYLDVRGTRFYGGAAGYWDTRADRPGAPSPYDDEYVVDQNLDRKLPPGGEYETFLCTDPLDLKVREALRRNKGQKIAWRFQVRQGLVDVKGKRIPACAVVEVEIDEKDIKNSKEDG